MHPYVAGDRIAHVQYGDGTVTSVDEYHTRIKFDAHGLHTFVSKLVSLASSDTPAPTRAAARRQKRAPASVTTKAAPHGTAVSGDASVKS
jgi:hypothetical protein